jgi:hypothetical protein
MLNEEDGIKKPRGRRGLRGGMGGWECGFEGERRKEKRVEGWRRGGGFCSHTPILPYIKKEVSDETIRLYLDRVVGCDSDYCDLSGDFVPGLRPRT